MGGLGKALSSTLVATLVYMAIPVSIALFTIGLLNAAAADLGEDLPDAAMGVLSYAEGFLDEFVFLVVLYAIPIVAVAFPYGLFGRGSRLRLLFGLAQVPLIALWLYFITGGGRVQFNLTEMAALPLDSIIPAELPLDFDLSAILALDNTGLIYLLMMLIFLKGAVHIAEYGGYRGRHLRMKHPEEEKAAPAREPRKAKKKRDDEWEFL